MKHVYPAQTQTSSLQCSPEDALGPWLPTVCPAMALVNCADVQADLGLRWAFMQSCRNCCASAHLQVLARVNFP